MSDDTGSPAGEIDGDARLRAPSPDQLTGLFALGKAVDTASKDFKRLTNALEKDCGWSHAQVAVHVQQLLNAYRDGQTPTSLWHFVLVMAARAGVVRDTIVKSAVAARVVKSKDPGKAVRTTLSSARRALKTVPKLRADRVETFAELIDGVVLTERGNRVAELLRAAFDELAALAMSDRRAELSVGTKIVNERDDAETLIETVRESVRAPRQRGWSPGRILEHVRLIQDRRAAPKRPSAP